jgi:hypothetical protein
MATSELLLHPVRLRVVHALSGGREATTRQLAALLPDVSKVTLYRQVAVLLEGGFLDIAGEQRIRGAVERRYRLRQDRPVIDLEAASAMTLDDHRRGFAAAMAVLIAEFDAYLDREGSEPTTDAASYRQTILWLSPDELAEMTGKMLAIVRDSMAKRPAAGRAPYLLSAILFPTAPEAIR